MKHGDTLKHLKTGNIYWCLGPSRFKQNGKWTETITYQNSDGAIFHRNPNDFGGFEVMSEAVHKPLTTRFTRKGPGDRNG